VLNEIYFEDECKDGVKSGKGKEFNYNVDLKFEGEYIDGEKTGKFKQYYITGELYSKGIYFEGEIFGNLNNITKMVRNILEANI